MANFGSYFLRGFQPNFQSNFGTAFEYGLRQQQRQADLEAELAKQKATQDIFNQLIKGTRDNYQFAGIYSPALKTEVPLTEDQKLLLYSRLPTDKQNAYEWITRQRQEQLKSQQELQKQKEYQGILDQLIKGDNLSDEEKFRLYSSLPTDKQNAYEYWMKQKQPKETYIADLPSGDKMKKLKGYEDPNADPKDPSTYIDPKTNKKYKITDYTVWDKYEKRGDGKNSSFGLSGQTKKMLSDYYQKQQELTALTKAGFGDEINNQGLAYKEELNRLNKSYAEFVKNIMPKTAVDYYKELYNSGVAKNDVTYLKAVRDAYKLGELGRDTNSKDNYEDADFEALMEMFKATYGYDPQQRYGLFLEGLDNE
jgi:hypothetical protein